MKRFLIALLVGGALFAVVFGAAASLTVEGGTIQAGKDTDLACQPPEIPVNVVYRTCAGGGGDARIFGLELSNFHSDCNGQVVLAYLTNNTGNWLPAGNPSMWKASAAIAGNVVVVDTYYETGGTWHIATCGQGPLVSLVEQVHLIVKSGFASGE